jgi:hypothetical protein
LRPNWIVHANRIQQKRIDVRETCL